MRLMTLLLCFFGCLIASVHGFFFSQVLQVLKLSLKVKNVFAKTQQAEPSNDLALSKIN